MNNIENKDKNKSFVNGVFEWAEEFVYVIVFVVLLFSFVFRVVTVNGTSMQPNYYENDRLIVSNFYGEVSKGDVVVVVDVLDDPIIKRVIATEGQTVDIDSLSGVVYVDGNPIDESEFGIENGITRVNMMAGDTLDFPQVVPEGAVFVLGDNRIVSEDSRYTEVGMIDVRKILGKAVLCIFPFEKVGIID